MSAVVIVGAQWGDEGKGKIVDFCTEYADMVVRYAGGPNAGHTLVVGDDKLIEAIRAHFKLSPGHIIRELDLRRPIYQRTAAYGHFGRQGEGFLWEETPYEQVFRDLK